MQKADPKRYCGIVFIGGGSSWVYAATPEDAAQRAARQARGDWKHLFKFEKGQNLGVLVYDMKDHSGWYATGPGVVFSKDTKKRLEPLQVVQVSVDRHAA